MTEKRIIYKDIEGIICVIIPAYNDRTRPPNETDDQFLIRVAAKDVPAATPYNIIDLDGIPQDRTFRNAWEDTGTAIKVNMPKARMLHMGQIRQARDAELVKLDVPYMKALEVGNTVEQQRIAELKQVLRDIPQTFDLAKYRTPTTLKAAWPAELPKT